MYSDFVFLDRFLFELPCKNTHTHKHGHTHTHRDSDEYPIVAFSKNATIIIVVICLELGLHPLLLQIALYYISYKKNCADINKSNKTKTSAKKYR